MQSPTKWFETWFDSPYYHILYKDRDQAEAEHFITNIVSHLKPPPDSNMLDLACGKGRHAIFLASFGFDVTGIDLSPLSIREAGQRAHDHLRFQVHDMRNVFKKGHFDYIFNMFTSFGYFEYKLENMRTVEAMYENLKSGGIAMIDFLNVKHVLNNLVEQEEKTVDGITFKIKRGFENHFIVKDIALEIGGEQVHFQEKVMALGFEEVLYFFRQCNFKLLEVFGNYDLHTFDEQNSDRLIFIIKKS